MQRYDTPKRRLRGLAVDVLTPPAILAVLSGGYGPALASERRERVGLVEGKARPNACIPAQPLSLNLDFAPHARRATRATMTHHTAARGRSSTCSLTIAVRLSATA